MARFSITAGESILRVQVDVRCGGTTLANGHTVVAREGEAGGGDRQTDEGSPCRTASRRYLVMVALYCPGVAVLLAVSVSVLELVVGFGEKDAVTPLGKPVTARFTLPVNPYCGFTETEAELEPPWPTDVPPAESVKLGAATETLRVALTVKLPEVPVMVALYCPGVAVLLAATVNDAGSGCRIRAEGCSHTAGQAAQGEIQAAAETILRSHVYVGCGWRCSGQRTRYSPKAWKPSRRDCQRKGCGLRVTLPELPVMVSVVVPGLAVLLAVTVSVLEPVVGFGGEGCSYAGGQASHGKIHAAGKSILRIHRDVS